MSCSKKNKRGFTIMEMLVAMVILAVIAAVIFNVFRNSAAQQAFLEDRTVALIIADNHLNQIYASEAAVAGNDVVQMAGKKFTVVTKLANENDLLTRIVVEVYAEKNPKPLAALTSFTGSGDGK